MNDGELMSICRLIAESTVLYNGKTTGRRCVNIPDKLLQLFNTVRDIGDFDQQSTIIVSKQPFIIAEFKLYSCRETQSFNCVFEYNHEEYGTVEYKHCNRQIQTSFIQRPKPPKHNPKPNSTDC